MNWTPQDALRFHNWECNMMIYHAHKKLHPESSDPPPSKPPNYDLWKYGPELIEIEIVPSIKCQGGELVNPEWVKQKTRQ